MTSLHLTIRAPPPPLVKCFCGQDFPTHFLVHLLLSCRRSPGNFAWCADLRSPGELLHHQTIHCHPPPRGAVPCHQLVCSVAHQPCSDLDQWCGECWAGLFCALPLPTPAGTGIYKVGQNNLQHGTHNISARELDSLPAEELEYALTVRQRWHHNLHPTQPFRHPKLPAGICRNTSDIPSNTAIDSTTSGNIRKNCT